MQSDVAPEAAALLTIDVQRDFALPSAPAHIPGTVEAAARIQVLAEAFRATGHPIVHLVRLYLPDGSNADLPRRSHLKSGSQLVCPGTTGAELLDELKVNATVRLDADLLLSGEPMQLGSREWVLYKPRWERSMGRRWRSAFARLMWTP